MTRKPLWVKATGAAAPPLWVALLLSFAAAGGAAAQDAAVVNAKLVQVKVDNDRVRVFETVLPPGAKEQMHSHPASIFYVVAGGKVRSHDAEGKVTEMVLATGDSMYRAPLTHWAENVGTTPIHLLVIELKEAH